jgi:hypothetical protein
MGSGFLGGKMIRRFEYGYTLLPSLVTRGPTIGHSFGIAIYYLI